MLLLVVDSAARANFLSPIVSKMEGVSVISCNGVYAGLSKKHLAFDPKSNFIPKYEIRDAKSLVRLKEAIANATEVIAATPTDDEGEFIAKQVSVTAEFCSKPFSRISFNEFSVTAVVEALADRSSISDGCVNAYLAREAVERFIYYEIGPLLEKKLGPGARHVRLHTAYALGQLARRERKIRARVAAANPWGIYATLQCGAIAESVESFSSEQEAINAAEQVRNALPAFTSATRAESAPEPFNTSSLLLFLASRYDFSVVKSLDLCDALCGLGLITTSYTASTTFTSSTVDDIREFVSKTFGSTLLSAAPRCVAPGGEAIRPSVLKLSPADSLLAGDLRTVYSAIWFRTLASQGASSLVEDQRATYEQGGVSLRASGILIKNLGWHQLSSKLFLTRTQVLEDGQLSIIDYAARPRIGSGPVRHTHASLHRKLNDTMIGRPSLYRSIFSHLSGDGYIQVQGGTIRPTLRGEALVTFLKKTVPDLLDVDFCAEIEEEIDSVRSGASLDAFLRYYWDWTQNACSLISTKSLQPKFRCPEDDSSLHVWLPAKSDPILQSSSSTWSGPFFFDAKGHIVLTQRNQ